MVRSLLLLQPPIPTPDRATRLDAPTLRGSYKRVVVMAGHDHAGFSLAHIEQDNVGPAARPSTFGRADEDVRGLVQCGRRTPVWAALQVQGG